MALGRFVFQTFVLAWAIAGASLFAACPGGQPRCIGEGALSADSPWPKFRGNMRQDGLSNIIPDAATSSFWSYPTGKGIFSSPVIGADGTIYIGSADRYFYALNPDGTLKWRILTGEIVDSAALLDDRGRVYFGSGDGQLRALDAQTGRLIWNFVAEEPSVNNALINWFEGNVAIGPDGNLYAPNDNFAVYAIDRDSGERVWKWPMNDQTWSSPAVDPASGNLFLGNNYLAAMQWLSLFWKNTFALRSDGSMIWRNTVQATIAASPMLTRDGKMIVGAFDGFVRAYDQASGGVLWSFATNDHIYSSPALLPDGTIVQPSTDGSVYGLSAANGSLRWRFEAGEPIRSSPSVDGLGRIYFGGGDGRLYALNANGTLRWSLQLIHGERNDVNSSPALGHNAIYIAGESGEIFSVPYDFCLSASQRQNPDCIVGGAAQATPDGVTLQYVSPLGAAKNVMPNRLSANQPLAFTLSVKRSGAKTLALFDESSIQVVTSPSSDIEVQVSGDRRFFTVVPTQSYPAGRTVRFHITGTYLTQPTRSGLRLVGGNPTGTFEQQFDIVMEDGNAADIYPVPQNVGDSAGAFELYRLAVPLPTIMPSYNQIGFDSLHYLVGMVEGTEEHAIGWMVGAKRDVSNSATIPDGESKVLFPVMIDRSAGLITLLNEDGFMVNAMNADIPFSSFRVSANLDRLGNSIDAPGVYVTTRCGEIPKYGSFLAGLGFCNPETDRLSVFGSLNIRPFNQGSVTAPDGVGNVSFTSYPAGFFTSGKVVATISGSSINPSEHSVAILLVDSSTGRPISLKYGLQTTRSVNSDGGTASVTLSLKSSRALPRRVRAYLMVDTYPAAKAEFDLR